MTQENGRPPLTGQPIDRRGALKLFRAALAGVLLSACGTPTKNRPTAGSGTANFAARFAPFEPAIELDVTDLTTVSWPDFVNRAGPEVKGLYEFQLQHGELMKYMPCFCGCGADGHRNNRDCYVKQVNADGSVLLDSMAPT